MSLLHYGKRLLLRSLPTRLNNSQCLSCSAPLKLQLGDSACVTKVFTAEEIQQFADITFDTNPLHLDAAFASETRFKKPVVHGVLMVGLFSGLLGTKLPGPGSIVMSYSIDHPSPLFVHEEVTAKVTLVELHGRKAKFDMICKNSSGRTVTKGVSHILLPKNTG